MWTRCWDDFTNRQSKKACRLFFVGKEKLQNATREEVPILPPSASLIETAKGDAVPLDPWAGVTLAGFAAGRAAERAFADEGEQGMNLVSELYNLRRSMPQLGTVQPSIAWAPFLSSTVGQLSFSARRKKKLGSVTINLPSCVSRETLQRPSRQKSKMFHVKHCKGKSMLL